MDTHKKNFYKATAKRLAASTILYNVDSVVHVENKDDIWFWQQVLTQYRRGKYKFIPCTTNEKGNLSAGCTQCLKYIDFLSQRFFICIDSDLRYLLNENNFSAKDGILQTYTYSWENHCAFASKLQNSFDKYTHKGNIFDFKLFLYGYAESVYEAFILMLYQERNKLTDFNQYKFRSLISLQYRYGDENDNGKQFLDRLTSVLTTETKLIKDKCKFNFAEESVRYKSKGIHKNNVYLYVRGHCLYNSLISIGNKLCEKTGVDFEFNILKDALTFEQYNEISLIKTDIETLKSIRIGD